MCHRIERTSVVRLASSLTLPKACSWGPAAIVAADNRWSASDLIAYAGQLAARAQTEYVPFDIAVDRDADPADLLAVIQATGTMLAAVVCTTPAQVRAWHPFGLADPEGFAAMGIVETVVHTYDIATGLGLDWVPPRSLCAKTLARLFPTAPGNGDPWQVLLWATGRLAALS